jgi:hypothetical protein
VLCAIGLAVVVGLAGCARRGGGAGPSGPPARLVDVTGAVTVNGQAAAAGRDVLPGDTVRAPLGAAARIQYPDGSRILLLGRAAEGSELTIAPAVVEGSVTVALLKLTRGLLAFAVTPAGREKARYEIEATSSLTVVRGTEGKVQTGRDADVVALRRGAVEVIAKATHESAALAAGQQVSVTPAGSLRTAPYDFSAGSEPELYEVGEVKMRSFDRR